MRNRHLQYQEADRKIVSTGARRKPSWVLKKCHISRAFSRRRVPWLTLGFFMLPSMLSRFVHDYRFPLGVRSFVPLCTSTCTLHARPCPSQPFLSDGSKTMQLSRPNPRGLRPRRAVLSSCLLLLP